MLCALQCALPCRCTKVFVRDQRETFLQRELLRAFAHEQYVARFLHHPPCELDGVSDVFETRHCARGKGAAVHDRGIELGPSAASEHCSATRIEEWIVFR